METKAVAEVVQSGHWAGGERVASLEESLAGLFSARGAVAIGSGVGALRLALMGLGVRAGTPVVVPGYSCVALANAVLALGARPVPVDCAVGEVNPNPSEIVAKAQQVEAFLAVVVHTFGQPVDLAPLKNAGLIVVEDCSHGMPWNQDGTPRPLEGDAAVLSFYATKLIGGGEGGAVVTNDTDVLESVLDLRDYTDKAAMGVRLNDKMNDLEAALAQCQLSRLPSLVEARAERAARYRKRLSEMVPSKAGTSLPPEYPGRIWYRYTVRLPSFDLDRVMAQMLALGVQTARPVSLWVDRADCPEAHRTESEILSLPLYPTLGVVEQDTVVSALRQILS
ncbi:DegT/DnrJ/EryC1/StrS family aminotransferase [Thiohalorhabdus sp. Cl-TMA]|uniref:DegT/DnrJ/EryC1/StrS family aminotransferase n=1 Tax=Thiohalorhabdus methylotrophus TaxID=3242694 RepID=A0ABV4TZ65_9GAMM